MADIRKKQRLGAIDLRQRLGARAFVLIGLCIGDCRRKLCRYEIEKAAVVLVEGASRRDACDQQRDGRRCALLSHRDRDRLSDRILPERRANPVGTAAQVNELHSAAADRRREGPRRRGFRERHLRRPQCRRQQPVTRSERCPLLRFMQYVDTKKRHVERVVAEDVDQGNARFLGRSDAGRMGGEVAQRSQAPLAHDFVGDFGDDTQHAGDAAVVVINRAVGEGVIGLFSEPAALEKQQQCLIPGGLPLRQHLFDARADVRPYFLPDLVRARAEHPVTLDAHGGKVGVVAKECQVRPP